MKLLVLTLPLFLVGCGLCPTKVQIVEVKIPVATVPAPPVTVKPKLDLENVNILQNGYDGYVRALESDLVRMKAYSDSLENVIHTYDTLSKKLEAVNPKESKDGNQK